MNHDPDWSLLPKCDYADSAITKNDPTVLRLLQLNRRGLVNKQDDLNELLITNDIDIALICETWLSDYNIGRVAINGYDFVFENRKNRKGGGVGIFLRNTLKYRKHSIPVNDLEQVVVEIKNDTGSLLVSSCYRPPDTNIAQFLESYGNLAETLQQIMKGRNNVVVIGLDHNLDLLKLHLHKPN